jgi:hypothetical protein
MSCVVFAVYVGLQACRGNPELPGGHG